MIGDIKLGTCKNMILNFFECGCHTRFYEGCKLMAGEPGTKLILGMMLEFMLAAFMQDSF